MDHLSLGIQVLHLKSLCFCCFVCFHQVVKNLKERYNGIYDEQNVLISATHTHSGPGGFLQYVLYIMTTQGFIRQNFEAIVSGILRVRHDQIDVSVW
jgi:hypothetical protein